MTATLLRLSALALAALGAGCATFQSISPGTPAQEVRARVGAPATVWKDADGSEQWEYPLGPLGTETYMVTLGPDNAVRQVRQVLNDANISELKAGMPRDEVRRRLGRPGYVSYSGSSDEEVWYWLYREWSVRKMELYVQFDRSSGLLTKVTRYQLDTGDGKRP